jgi:hypothetical protein
MNPVVFLGPSLPLAEARSVLDAVYMPPLAQGDLTRLMRDKPSIVVIIDGRFDDIPAVWHNEILFAMEHGTRVIGAASMGALRAAELARHGMIGVGAVYQAFRRGWLEDDDEVAVVHAPAELGWTPLSEAMVNIRTGIRAAVRGKLLSEVEGAAVVGVAKGLHYPERSWANLAKAAQKLMEDGARRIQLIGRDGRVDIKARDARAALVRARILQKSKNIPQPAQRLRVEPTEAWLTLLEETGCSDLYESPPRLDDDKPFSR